MVTTYSKSPYRYLAKRTVSYSNYVLGNVPRNSMRVVNEIPSYYEWYPTTYSGGGVGVQSTQNPPAAAEGYKWVRDQTGKSVQVRNNLVPKIRIN